MTKIQRFNYSVDLLKAILWQYNDAVNLQSLLQQKQDWYADNQQSFWENWFSDVFDLQTANEFGCAVWAIILGIPLNVVISPTDRKAFGFGSFHFNFDRGNFNDINPYSINLTLEQKRIVLRLRYFQLVCRGTIPEINKFLKELFKDEGDVYVLDGYDMTITYVFTFVPTSSLRFVLDNFDLLPRPAGVKVKYTVLTETSFGFDQYHVNYDRGNFFN